MYAGTSTAALALYIATFAKEIGWSLQPRLLMDSSAAIAASNRLRMGKMKHMELRHLFLKELVRGKRLRVDKVETVKNRADNGTKWLTGPRMKYLRWMIGLLADSEHEEKGKE